MVCLLGCGQRKVQDVFFQTNFVPIRRGVLLMCAKAIDYGPNHPQ